MDLVQVIKALGDETRIRILNILNDGELCVGEIEHILGITQSNASRHLNKLFSLKIIGYEKKAQWVYYKINSKLIEEYPFIKQILDIELKKIDRCILDTEKMKAYKSSGMTCENLRECKSKSE